MTAQETLKEYWGYDSFRPKQEEIVSAALEGRDVLAILPTGGGKSVCFQVPGMMKEGIAIVVTPLIALMKDQVQNLTARGIRALCINAGMGRREVDNALNNALYGDFKFLYVSPERLGTRLFQSYLQEMNVSFIVVDEAHCISQWGYDFRPDYLQIGKLRQLVDHDPLTGVLSLDGFRKRAEELLRTHPDTPYLLVYTNIKNFKFINDSLGRAAGDDLLRFWANRTLATFSDEEAMGRVTADRFAVLRRNGGDEVLRKDDQEVLGPVRTYFMDRGKENRVLLCGGVYVVTSTDRQQINIDHMMDRARMAEKKVRDTRNEGHDFYNPEQWEKEKQIAEVINHLPAAIKSGSLHVWYQPQVNYDTGKITGAEALCRWDHDQLGFLYPSDFITVLEESGLIYDLDCFVWDKVCQDLHRWNEQGYHRSISVNVSRCDIREDRDIPGQFSSLIQKYNISPDQLRIEITETAFAENPDLLISNTNRLRELGFQVEMDDFGSGYSSLNMLKEMPLDDARNELMKIKGVGPKVAACTLLFGCGHISSFPVDVWIKRAMQALFSDGLPEVALPYAGIVQQYIFHYARLTKLEFDE